MKQQPPEFDDEETTRHSDLPSETLTRLGRYEIRHKLGSGGFAEVYLAHDEQLDRLVALKIPRSEKFRSLDELKSVTEEARTAARLQHPNIVTVFDVGTDNGKPFIVLEYIRGRSLGHLLSHETPTHLQAAQLIADVAKALQHAHNRGFVHRDIKPGNILLDSDDRPHVADFGLALRPIDAEELSLGAVAGTVHYMSPEQVRAENHRIDGRTDIWALGVVLYRLLTKQTPFPAASAREVAQKILYHEPVSPREIAANVPLELERICLRCLQKRMTERYYAAGELADDLNRWVRFITEGSDRSSQTLDLARVPPPDTPVIPKGLRSYAEEDAEFFLKLVPGPCDRDGLPAVIRFWNNWVGQRLDESTSAVGLLYGPSGCGKSSLVKAGLLPRMREQTLCFYIEAMQEGTEAKVLNQLQRDIPGLGSQSLAEAVHDLRENPALSDKRVVLFIFDQFEQWLNGWNATADSELVRMLRQCDGYQVKSLLLVRDDFWLPLSRLMRMLEIGIIDGVNATLVDSFDVEHGKKVLREFGVAYGRVSPTAANQTDAQTEFINQSVVQLARDQRLYPIRLAAFIEMVKDRDWNPSALEEMGGAEGVGVSFLEASLGPNSAPARRLHEKAVRSVLSSLLPPAGQIKGGVRTRAELLTASGYQLRPNDFEEVLQLLDTDLRLITATQPPEDEHNGSTSVSTGKSQETQYQLTHDYLVPSIRAWLERRMRGTRRGRAQMMLSEQAELWNSRPSNRYLPSTLESLSYYFLTDRSSWNAEQRRLMKSSGRRFIRRALVAIIVCSTCVGILLSAYRRQHGNLLVSQLQDVDIRDVDEIVASMSSYRGVVDPLLAAVADDEGQSARRRMRAAIALLPSDTTRMPWLVNHLVDRATPPEDFLILREMLVRHAPEAGAMLGSMLLDESLDSRTRFRVACGYAAFNPDSGIWSDISAEIAVLLSNETAAVMWLEVLQPIANHMPTPMVRVLRHAPNFESARLAVFALQRFDASYVNTLVEALSYANGHQYRAIAEALVEQPTAALPKVLASAHEERSSVSDQRATISHRVNTALAAFQLGDPSLIRTHAAASADPRVRESLIHALDHARIDLTLILPLILQSSVDEYDPLRNVALKAMCRHLERPLSDDFHGRETLTDKLIKIYQKSPDAEAHSAAELLLRRLKETSRLEQATIRTSQPPEGQRWYVTPMGIPMVVVVGNTSEPGLGQRKEFPYSFAISSGEITIADFRKFRQRHEQRYLPNDDPGRFPVAGLYTVAAAEYCNWLSREEGFLPHEWCYPTKLSTSNCSPVPDFLKKTGYRLPTEAEWEFVCRAGADTPLFLKDDVALMKLYGWFSPDAQGVFHPTRLLLPNALGMFDMFGNVDEACLRKEDDGVRHVSKGGTVFMTPSAITSATSNDYNVGVQHPSIGFRIVRIVN